MIRENIDTQKIIQKACELKRKAARFRYERDPFKALVFERKVGTIMDVLVTAITSDPATPQWDKDYSELCYQVNCGLFVYEVVEDSDGKKLVVVSKDENNLAYECKYIIGNELSKGSVFLNRSHLSLSYYIRTGIMYTLN